MVDTRSNSNITVVLKSVKTTTYNQKNSEYDDEN